MRVALSADMEAVSQITSPREVVASCPEYWDSGRAKLTADVVAAAQGLLDAGATEVVVLDNHASGHACNVLLDALPRGVRAAEWHVFDLERHGVDALLQVGYHPRAGVPGFLPHTYVPGLRLAVGEEEIGESHGRAWAARVPLLGIVGHAALGRTLGSLAGVPFLPVQESGEAGTAAPRFANRDDAVTAIRAFARDALRDRRAAPPAAAPEDLRCEARLDRVDDDVAATLADAGWTRSGAATFVVTPPRWAAFRKPLAAAMACAMRRFAPALGALDLSSRAALDAQDAAARDALVADFLEATGTAG